MCHVKSIRQMCSHSHIKIVSKFVGAEKIVLISYIINLILLHKKIVQPMAHGPVSVNAADRGRWQNT